MIDVRSTLLDAVEELKGAEVRAAIEANEPLEAEVDSLDLLEVLLSFDERAGVTTDPQDLPESLTDLDAVVEALTALHGAAPA